MSDSFTMGVLVHMSPLTKTKADPSKHFLKFQISDLRRYDDLLTQFMRGHWKEELKDFKKFKLTPSGYKTVEWIVFGEVATKLQVRILKCFLLINSYSIFNLEK